MINSVSYKLRINSVTKIKNIIEHVKITYHRSICRYFATVRADLLMERIEGSDKRSGYGEFYPCHRNILRRTTNKVVFSFVVKIWWETIHDCSKKEKEEVDRNVLRLKS